LSILFIIVFLFGTKRLRSLGKDLGSAMRGFRAEMKDGEVDETPKEEKEDSDVKQADKKP